MKRGRKAPRDVCSGATTCVPRYASLSDNERNEMRELVLPCYVHPSVRLPAGTGAAVPIRCGTAPFSSLLTRLLSPSRVALILLSRIQYFYLSTTFSK